MGPHVFNLIKNLCSTPESSSRKFNMLNGKILPFGFEAFVSSHLLGIFTRVCDKETIPFVSGIVCSRTRSVTPGLDVGEQMGTNVFMWQDDIKTQCTAIISECYTLPPTHTPAGNIKTQEKWHFYYLPYSRYLYDDSILYLADPPPFPKTNVCSCCPLSPFINKQQLRRKDNQPAQALRGPIMNIKYNNQHFL